MQIIDTQNKLDEALRDINSNKIIGVDTEFVRTNSFWPKLCTIQISTKSNFYLIDALSNLSLNSLSNTSWNKSLNLPSYAFKIVFLVDKYTGHFLSKP